jgi:hypothetical protein
MGASGNSLPRAVSGHVFRVDGRRGPRWYAKYRLPDGRQVQKALGPAWTQRGRPAEGYFTKRTAEAWLRDVLDQARRGMLPGMVRTGATFADATQEWLRFVEQERGRKPSTLADYRSVVRAHLLPAFGEKPLESVTTEMIEVWLAAQLREGRLSRRSLQKIVVLLHGIFRRAKKVWKLPQNPVADIDKPTAQRRTEIVFYSPEEVHALMRAASSEQDGAIFPDGGADGAADGGAAGAALARCGLRRADGARGRELHGGLAGHPEVGVGPGGPARGGRSRRRLRDWGAGSALAARTIWCSSVTAGATSTGRRCGGASRRHATRRGCVRCAFTTCGTRSGAWRSARPTHESCRSGWGTPTSPRRRSTCTIGHGRTPRGGSRRHSRLATLAASRLKTGLVQIRCKSRD